MCEFAHSVCEFAHIGCFFEKKVVDLWAGNEKNFVIYGHKKRQNIIDRR